MGGPPYLSLLSVSVTAGAAVRIRLGRCGMPRESTGWGGGGGVEEEGVAVAAAEEEGVEGLFQIIS